MFNRTIDSRQSWKIGSRTAGAALLLTVVSASPVAAQDGPSELTLQEAVALAEFNNPTFLSRQNDVGAAAWGLRSAYGAFLPTASASGNISYTAPGVQSIGVFTSSELGGSSSDIYFSRYSLNLGYSLSPSTFFNVSSAKAQHRAAQANFDAERFNLESAVTTQYFVALRARDAVAVAAAQAERSRENWEIASGRVEAGAAVSTEGKQAEVEMGRSDVALLQAEHLLRTEKLRLAEQLGIELSPDVVLASEFDVFDPTWSGDELLQMALDAHPQLNALVAQERAAGAQVRQAQSAYLPTINASAGWSGFARQQGDEQLLIDRTRNSFENARESCEEQNDLFSRLADPLPPNDCSGLVLTEEGEQLLLESNDVFPFNFTKSPFNASLTINVPIFQGFNRQQRVAQASQAHEDARHNRRAQELRIRTNVTSAYDNLETSLQIVAIEERNLEVATQQLELARERYRLGAANYLELLDAQNSLATAERDHLNAVYNFHGAIIGLEAAAGIRLRETEGNEEGN